MFGRELLRKDRIKYGIDGMIAPEKKRGGARLYQESDLTADEIQELIEYARLSQLRGIKVCLILICIFLGFLVLGFLIFMMFGQGWLR